MIISCDKSLFFNFSMRPWTTLLHYFWTSCTMSQPHFGLSVRMKLTPPKVGTWSPPGLPKTQSSIAGVKTPRSGVFFVSLERSWRVDVQNGLAWTIWTSAAQVMGKEGPAVWLLATKSRESTRIRRLQKEYGMALESSQRELQDFFRPHPNPRSKQEVIDAQSPGSPNRDSFGTPPWKSLGKKAIRM